MLILCQARPELFEVRPGWAMAKSNATLIPLEGLTEVETTTLIENLVGPAESVSDARARLGEMAEGNPLFVEEMLRMLVDDGLLRRTEDGWAVEGDLAAVDHPAHHPGAAHRAARPARRAGAGRHRARFGGRTRLLVGRSIASCAHRSSRRG